MPISACPILLNSALQDYLPSHYNGEVEDYIVSNGWYEPDVGPMEPLPASLLASLDNMEEACIEADKRAVELAEASEQALRDLWLG
jgi:hypothetical protein